jgi:hypothetical protein
LKGGKAEIEGADGDGVADEGALINQGLSFVCGLVRRQ